MKRAISLALGGQGNVSPNPLVGAIIVKDGIIIGEGFHKQYGGKHAEVIAIESCLESVEGTTLYCNLEPCVKVYPGKNNPPCCDLIIQSKIKKVIIGHVDPNPNVSGLGIKKLLESGIEVVSGVELEQALKLNRGFNTVQKFGRPYIHIKWAQTLDGKIASTTGISKWISSEACRKDTHFLRSGYDCIMVGRNTLELDNPTLDVRYGFSPSPRAIVIDPLLQLSPDLKIFNRNPVIICSNIAHKKRKSLFRGEFLPFPGKSFDLNTVIQSLKNLVFNSIFIEGGENLITQFINLKLWDEITTYTAPSIMGDGLSPVGDIGVSHPKDNIRFSSYSFNVLDNHMVFNGLREDTTTCLQE